MKIMIAAGGTGGHIYPGIAIAKYIQKNNTDVEILFVGTKKGLEKEIVPNEGFNIKLIRVRGFERRITLDTFKSVKELFLGLKDAKKIIQTFNPDMVIGTGGYVCGPILFMASRKRIPTLIHEQNAFPGITNRILSRFVDKIAVSFIEAKEYFNNKDKIFVSGNPIRDDFKVNNKNKAREELGIPKNATLITVMGGSQGALSINSSMIDVIKKYKNDQEVYIIHITGKNQYDKIISNLESNKINIDNIKNIEVLPYSFKIPILFCASDLIVSRSGAMTVSEICAVGRASILIPYPYATNNHQEYNARVITEKKGGVLIKDADLNGEKLYENIQSLINNKKKLHEMENITSKLGILNADALIYNEINKLQHA